jgi:type 1 glutamine amidotransferase
MIRHRSSWLTLAVFAVAFDTGHAGRTHPIQGAATVPAQREKDPAAGEGGVIGHVFTLLDASGDGTVTRDEMSSGFEALHARWDLKGGNAVTMEGIYGGLAAAIPASASAGRQIQKRTPRAEDVAAMIAALPARAPATPRQPRRVLVIGRAAGFVHSSIPLAARTIEEMGKRTGAWSTTTTYDAADVNDANLKQYDAIFLASTTGAFLDDPEDAAATAARRKALLDFVRGGKGLAGIHAASDAYHQTAGPAGGGAFGTINWPLLTLALELMAGDANADGRITREEFAAFGRGWFDRLDTRGAGRLTRAEFLRGYAEVPPPPPPARGPGNRQGPATDRSPDREVGTWPEFNTMLGAFFKFHWDDGQTITVRIDEPGHPLNAMFKGQGYVIVDETYTFGRNTYSRANLRVLTSVDYAKMSEEDKAKEQHPRPDGDYALSWIRREGKGRVFYEAHGHNEQVYAHRLLLEHLLAGMQYALGDLAADDSPSATRGR